MLHAIVHRYFKGAALAGLAICALTSPPATADTSLPGSRTKTVSLQDLDLSTTEGQRIAVERAHQMARFLCSRVSDDLDLSHRENFLACVASAVSAAREEIQALIVREAATRLADKPTAGTDR